MLQVLTFVGPSAIHGVGLFAADPIKKDTLIWVFDPIIDRIISNPAIDSVLSGCRHPEPLLKFIQHYGYMQAGLSDATWILCLDDARFVNHSDTPNTYSKYSDGSAPWDIFGSDYAACDINKGDEITSDYSLWDQQWYDKLKT